ncbi:hypothetical protein UY286_21960 [Paenibacillus polymyxa]|uniref:hypothetical protein n=1 Tax=Paenibacillus TaxID=44249 RepID=UPI0020B8EBA2|nr:MULTISPECIES: hypothetical protein [Paenibacillus]MCP3781477.1 hypothetical protein [Paenibacillus sp. MZ03-122A]MDY7991018.1 hypothetical protein [Paenibacillus polymyxa]MDY8120103.1 hypothetical protein [Paenibacillus polymyxa]
MMYLYAKEQGFAPLIADVEINAKRAQIREEQNCEVADLNISQGVVSFAYKPKSFPLAVNKAYQDADKFVSLTED